MNVNTRDQSVDTICKAVDHDAQALVERLVEDAGFVVAIIDGNVLPVRRLGADNVFCNYEVRCGPDETRYRL